MNEMVPDDWGSRFEELKRRKLFQWGLAYLAGAFAVLQLLDILAGHFAWPSVVTRGAIIFLAFGFFVALVLAWYHGEKGRQHVSGAELLMVAGILAVAGAAIAMASPGSKNAGVGTEATAAADEASVAADVAADSIPSRSIAVLPLDDHSADPRHAYFADAMTEEITSALSRVPELRVSARNSAAKFAGSDLTVGEFAMQELRVAHVLEGSVQLRDERARITVQLIDAGTEEHVWSESYEVELIDVLDVQVDIARQVAERLASTFSDREAERIRAGSTDDPRAYDLYLQAQGLAQPESLDDVNRVAALLGEAVSRDSAFALAYAELAFAYYAKRSMTGNVALTDSIGAALARAVATADLPASKARLRALQIIYFDEDVAEAIGLLRSAVREYPSNEDITRLLASLYRLDGNLSEAVRWGRQTIALDPLSPFNRLMLASVLRELGLDGPAERELERARELGNRTWAAYYDYHMLRGEYSETMRFADSARADGDLRADGLAGAARLWAGDIEGAHTLLRKVDDAVLPIDGWRAAPTIAHVMLLSGDTARAEELLDLASQDIPAAPRDVLVGPLLDAQVAAVRGDAESAAASLRRATELGWRGPRWIRSSPVYDRVRADSAFAAALAEQERLVARERREVERMLGEAN